MSFYTQLYYIIYGSKCYRAQSIFNNIRKKAIVNSPQQKKAPIKCYSKYIKQAKPPVKYTKVFAYVLFGGAEEN